ncbi:MAG: ABC transporter ATP-binding protein [Chloroflexi bacterium]|nr:ABC transporter ATP-binding protein [Chloroflexota bacterium]
MSSVHIENLKKHYGAVHALDGLNMDVATGTVFGFLGPNGAGKTTTLRILTGLAHPTSGKAQVAGLDVLRDGHKLARHIGHLPEEPAFYPWMTPLEFLDYLGRLYGFSAAERSSRTRELLALVRMEDVSRRRIGGFSRGMRQRLGVAAALIHHPEVLFLDEPASALDPVGRKEVLDLIENLRGQCTVVMSTHILADVERVCDVVGIIAKGKMLVQSPREELLERYAVPAFEVEADDHAALSRWAEDLRRISWVTAVTAQNGTLRITVKDVQTAKHDLLTQAVGAGLVLNRYEEIRPSLEDVFLQLVGAESVA